MGHNVLKIAARGAAAAGKTYVDDVFSTYLYDGNGSTQDIFNGIALASTAAWSAYKLKQNSSVGYGIATDGSGNFYVTGQANDGTLNYIITAKYNSSGVLQWQRKLQQNNSSGRGIAVDSSGNVYVTGYAADNLTEYIITAKYNSSGVLQWQRKLKENGSSGFGITVDASGNVYVTGYADPGTSFYIVTAKYNSSGVLQWQRKLNENSSLGYGIATDSSGNVYVTGQATDATNIYIITAKYNSSGSLQWQRKLKENSSVGNGITVDSSSNVYVTGYANDGTNNYIITAKYNSSGTIQWQRKLKQNNSVGYGITVDSSSNVYVTGSANDGTNNYIVIAKYNSSGTIQWQRKLQQNNSIGLGIAVDSSGNVYVTGRPYDGTNNYIVTLKLAQDGSTLSGTAFVTMTPGAALEAAGGATDSAGGATDSAGVATDSAGGATDSAGTATESSATQAAITSTGGMVWVKARASSVVRNHRLFDTVRGALNYLETNTTAAQASNSQSLQSFSSNGFGLGLSGVVNGSDGIFAAWTFRKAPKFFDVVTYTGNGTNRTIAHSLGSVPGTIIVKRTDTAGSWPVYHGNRFDVLFLNTTAIVASDATMWNDTSPTSSLFSVGTNANVNASGGTYVAYLFARNAGGFGSSGNESIVSSGTFSTDAFGNGAVNLGYEPQFLVLKSTNVATNWFVLDVMRGITTGGSDAILYPNLDSAEALASPNISVTATGFSISDAGQADRGFFYIAIRRPNKPPTSGTQVFQPTVYTGTNVNNRLVNTTIAPDMVWVRQRNDTVLAGLVVGDRLRGQPYLLTGSTAAEVTSATALDQQIVSTTQYGLAFSSMSGFWVGTDATAKLNVNTTASNHIAEAFKRAPGVFDVVCYPGEGNETGTNLKSHNLGVVPELIIVKNRSGAFNWPVWCAYSSGSFNVLNKLYVELNTTIARASSNYWSLNGDPQMTSSAFSLGSTYDQVNAVGSNYVAYLFASAAGISKVGSYTGNGGTVNTNGTSQTINCGFAAGARFVLVKRTDSTGDWYVFDSARGIVAASDPYLLTNSTAAEVTSVDAVDADNSGFIVNQTSGTNLNVTSATYIFLAYA